MANIIGDVIDAIFGGGGSKSDKSVVSNEAQTGTIKETGTQTSNKQDTSQTGSVQAGTQNQTTSGKTNTRTLSDIQIGAGDVVLQELTKGFSLADLSSLQDRIRGVNTENISAAELILNRANTGDASLAAGRNAIMENARAQAGKAREAQYQGIVRGAGSQFSSVAQQVFAQSTSDMEVQLGALAADQARQDRQLITQELMAGVDALGKSAALSIESELKIPALSAEIDATRSSAVSNVINSLKGGIASSDTLATVLSTFRNETQSTTNAASRDVTSTASTKDINLNTNTVQIGSEDVTQHRDLIDLITGLGKL